MKLGNILTGFPKDSASPENFMFPVSGLIPSYVV